MRQQVQASAIEDISISNMFVVRSVRRLPDVLESLWLSRLGPASRLNLVIYESNLDPNVANHVCYDSNLDQSVANLVIDE